MLETENKSVLDQIYSLHRAAILLKEQYDKGRSESVIKAYAEFYLKEFQKLVQLIPSESLDISQLMKINQFIEEHPTKTYQPITEVCLTYINLFQKTYLIYLFEQVPYQLKKLL